MCLAYTIAFVDDDAQESSQLAMKLVNDLGNPHCKADSILINTDFTSTLNGSQTTQQMGTLLANEGQPVKNVIGSKNRAMLIGLCFGQSQATIVPLNNYLKNLGIEEQFATVAYWDLSHLVRNDPATFMDKLYRELEGRIGLLVGARF